MDKLSGKIALITGGSSGIGLSIAQNFVAQGAYVFITGRRQKPLDDVVQQIGKNVTAIQADVSNMDDNERVCSIIKQEKGHLDILVANAGICESQSLGAITEESFDNIFSINVKGVLFCVQKNLPIFTNAGSIIIIGSVASIQGNEGFSVYSASKAAIRSFARCWIVDLKERKIRVNVLSPGEISTAMDTTAFQNEEEFNKFIEAAVAATPLRRRGQPDEIGKAAVFLASDDSSFVTGIELFVDGGIGQI